MSSLVSTIHIGLSLMSGILAVTLIIEKQLTKPESLCKSIVKAIIYLTTISLMVGSGPFLQELIWIFFIYKADFNTLSQILQNSQIHLLNILEILFESLVNGLFIASFICIILMFSNTFSQKIYRGLLFLIAITTISFFLQIYFPRNTIFTYYNIWFILATNLIGGLLAGTMSLLITEALFKPSKNNMQKNKTRGFVTFPISKFALVLSILIFSIYLIFLQPIEDKVLLQLNGWEKLSYKYISQPNNIPSIVDRDIYLPFHSKVVYASSLEPDMHLGLAFNDYIEFGKLAPQRKMTLRIKAIWSNSTFSEIEQALTDIEENFNDLPFKSLSVAYIEGFQQTHIRVNGFDDGFSYYALLSAHEGFNSTIVIPVGQKVEFSRDQRNMWLYQRRSLMNPLELDIVY
jgi:hypothetical protein